VSLNFARSLFQNVKEEEICKIKKDTILSRVMDHQSRPMMSGQARKIKALIQHYLAMIAQIVKVDGWNNKCTSQS
jgi:hypothetical protein